MLKSANKSISGDGKKPTAKPGEVLGEQNKPSASAALRHGAAQMPGNALSNSPMLQNSCWWKSSNLLPPSSQQCCIEGSSTPLATQFREPKWPRVSDYLPLLILVCGISSLNQTLQVKQMCGGMRMERATMHLEFWACGMSVKRLCFGIGEQKL